MPDDEPNRLLILDLESKLTELEAIHYRKEFKEKVNKLNQAKIDDASVLLKSDLLEEIKLSNCHYCRQQVGEALEGFNTQYNKFKRQEALSANKLILFNAQDVSFDALKREHCFDAWYAKHYSDSVAPPPHISMLLEMHDELRTKRLILEEFSSINFYELELDKINQYNQNLQELCSIIETSFLSLCKKLPESCNCED